MPSRRQALLDLSNVQGLTLTGPATSTPPTMLRKARGLHEICSGELRPSPGRTLLYARAGIHSIVRFNDVRYFAAGAVLYKANVLLHTNASSEKLTIQRMPPGNTQPDQLFWCGGGNTRKVDTAGTVTNWGIEPPPDQMLATIAVGLVKNIELFQVAADWTLSPGTVTAANEATIAQDGNSLRLNVPVETIATATKALVIDLSLFTTAGDSADEDFIELWIRIDGNSQAFDYFTLRFDVGGGDFASDYYQFKSLPTSVNVNQTTQTGIGTAIGVLNNEAGFVDSQGGSEAGGGVADSTSTGSLGDGLSDMGDSSGTMGSNATWTRLRLSKGSFTRSGNNGNTWASVVACQLQVKSNSLDALICYFDTMRMVGGAGMRGDYKSLVTFDNTITGARSNSNSTPVVTLQNDRQVLLYDDIPVSDDPQVNARTLWRTLGNGAAFFREHVIADNTLGTYDSRVADFIGLFSIDQAEILYLPELPTDNARPEDTHLDFLYDQATVFWLSAATGKKGRIYFSPAGRPEAQKGFIQVTNDDTPLYRIILWNRARYVVGEGGFYRIDGTTTYTSFKFQGVPGVLAGQAYTMTPTPYGILWHAKDGIRVFNGSTSTLLFPERLEPLFRGEAREQLSAFQGTCATFARDQYFISDDNQTLAINLTNGFIRDLGIGCTALYYEEDTRALLAALSDGLYILDDETLPAALTPFTIGTSSYLFPDNTVGWIDQVFIDGSLTASAVLHLDAQTLTLPGLTPSGRVLLERQVGYPARAVGLELSGSAPSTQSLYGAECAVRDCTLELVLPGGVISLRGRSSDLTASIFFQVLEEQRQSEPLESCLLAYRLTLDVHCHSTTIAATLHFEEGDVTLAALTNSARGLLQQEPIALGHLTGITLAGNFLTPLTIYRAELEMRPCTLELLIPQRTGDFSPGTILSLRGRSPSVAQSVIFEVREDQRQAEPFDNFLLSYLLTFDVACNGGTFTPILTFEEGTLTLPTLGGEGRSLQQVQFARLGHLLSVTLSGNFTHPITLYRAEMDLRPILLNVLVNGQYLPFKGRLHATSTGVCFELPDQLFLGAAPTQMMVIRRLTLDADSAGQQVTPSLITDQATYALPPFESPARAYREWALGLPGRPRQVVLDCDITLLHAIFAAELHLYVPTNGQRNQ